MLSISPLCGEWLRALAMPGAGLAMFVLGKRISLLSDRLCNAVSIFCGVVAIAGVSTHYEPMRSLLGATAERLGGEAAVTGYALLFLVGIAYGRKVTGVLNIAIGLAFAIILVFSSFPLYWHYFGNKAYSNFASNDGCIQQTTGFTCGAAAGTVLLKHYGYRVSEGLVAERAGTNIISGTNEYSLARTFESVTAPDGLRASAGHLDYDQAVGLRRPFVAYIVLPTIGGHAVVVKSLEKDAAVVSDPLSGSIDRMSISEFKTEWKGTAIWITGGK
ncbi:MAG TPA: cysteine peptidase family C39 domain-containing protein [Armatimonadota bacterium]|jgi:hypothetical protein